MMSIKRMHAGDSYQYLLRSVADVEGCRLGAAGSPMSRYYTEAGTPPGQWLGAGLGGLDRGAGLAAGSTVTAEQMERLFKFGVDPVTGDRLARMAFEVPVPWQERVLRRVNALPADLDAAAREQRTADIVAEERGRQVRRPVAGFDLTFSPPKSLSALWGLAGPELREQLYSAHRAAVTDTLALIERDVARTRVGSEGVAQVGTRGVIGAAFDHYDSRAGDPQLHTHVVLANRVQGPDGVWRTLDSHGALFPSVVAMSETYDALLADHVTARTGLVWERRGNPRKAKNQRWEIAGVPEGLIAGFSQRGASIEVEKDRLITDWVTTHGRQPDDATVIRLRQQATLVTRPDKRARSLADLSADWRARAQTIIGEDPQPWAARLSPARQAVSDRAPLSTLDVGGYAGEVLERLVAERSTWRRWNVHAEAARATLRLRVDPVDRDALITAVVDEVLSRSLALSGPALAHTPAAFRQPDGTSAFTPPTRDAYTAEIVLAAERRLLTAARTTGGPVVSQRTANQVASSTTADGRVLSNDQADAVTAVATSGRHVDVLVGPAGAGKTTALAALRRAWEIEHGAGSVVGLAPSAVAAEVLGDSLGIATDNTAKWTVEHRRAGESPDQTGRPFTLGDSTSAAPSASRHADADADDRWRLRPGQLVIVDEASLAGTLALDTIATAAGEAGAKLLLVGDWAQLSAVEAGGAFGMLVRDRDDVPELTGVRRFIADWEREASTRLRRGDEAVIDEYTDRGRITGGEHDAMLDAAYTAWAADTAIGKASLLIAGDNHTVRALNERARADRVASGDVAPDGVQLHDGTSAGAGDHVVTRHNDRTLSTGRGWVKNGDRWTVLTRHDGGGLGVRRASGGPTITLPAEYVAEHVELGYATTAHRAQGATVDTAHAIVTGPSMTREVLYVALTRGRHANHAYVATDHAADACEPAGPDDPTPSAVEVLTAVMRNRGAQLSAHETMRADQEHRSSIKVLAAEYDTIARHGHATRWQALLTTAGWDTVRPEALFDTPAAGALVAALRRADAYGLDVAAELPRLASEEPLPAAADHAAAELSQRLHAWSDATAVPARSSSRRFIAGLVPIAGQTGDPDTDLALTERQALMESRATELVDRAARDRAPWLTALGGRPADPAAAAAWQRSAATMAAYRDRHDITAADPLGGSSPRSWSHRADHRRAAAALDTARRLTAPSTSPLGQGVTQADLAAGRTPGR